MTKLVNTRHGDYHFVQVFTIPVYIWGHSMKTTLSRFHLRLSYLALLSSFQSSTSHFPPKLPYFLLICTVGTFSRFLRSSSKYPDIIFHLKRPMCNFYLCEIRELHDNTVHALYFRQLYVFVPCTSSVQANNVPLYSSVHCPM